MAGYHFMEIAKGELGELSKIQEELLEAMDAEIQGSRIMVLLELSDLLGAIELYLQKKFPDMTMEDLHIMSKITQRAFASGGRS